jgi:hypothetical protein
VQMDGLQEAQKACCITERSQNEYSPFINRSPPGSIGST